MTIQNTRRIELAHYPDGTPRESDFRLVKAQLPAPAEGELLVRIAYISVDPYIRGRLRPAPRSQSYIAPIAVGDVMESGAVAEVVESNAEGFAPGDFVEAHMPWQDYAVIPAKRARRIDKSQGPVSAALGVLGMTGLTAYFGLLEIGKPKAGETVVVSGAAGATGSVAGQIAKILGCRVTGTAGSEEKVRYLIDDLGFDAAYNYKTVTDHPKKLAELCPEGVDVYFDNTGGDVTDGVFLNIRQFARIVLCGQIAQYNNREAAMGPRLLFQLVVKQARAEGFLVFQFAQQYEQGRTQLAAWLREGRLKHRESFVDGLENAPHAFIALFTGDNFGKQLVRLPS